MHDHVPHIRPTRPPSTPNSSAECFHARQRTPRPSSRAPTRVRPRAGRLKATPTRLPHVESDHRSPHVRRFTLRSKGTQKIASAVSISLLHCRKDEPRGGGALWRVRACRGGVPEGQGKHGSGRRWAEGHDGS